LIERQEPPDLEKPTLDSGGYLWDRDALERRFYQWADVGFWLTDEAGVTGMLPQRLL
jgi:hypothetical protein